jgi:hypothetical protein
MKRWNFQYVWKFLHLFLIFCVLSLMKSLLLVSLCLIVGAHCWGPISHLYFVCQAEDLSNLDDCLNSLDSQYLFWGGLLPDGLTIDPFLENNNCSWSPHTHDPVFSGTKCHDLSIDTRRVLVTSSKRNR